MLSRVYTWRDGRLRIQNEPLRRSPDWYIDFAATSLLGLRFYTAGGQRHLVVSELGRGGIADEVPYTGRAVTFRWSRGNWVRSTVRSISIPTSSSVAKRTYGWNGVDLPKE